MGDKTIKRPPKSKDYEEKCEEFFRR